MAGEPAGSAKTEVLLLSLRNTGNWKKQKMKRENRTRMKREKERGESEKNGKLYGIIKRI